MTKSKKSPKSVLKVNVVNNRLIPVVAAIVGPTLATLIGTVGGDVSDFVAVEASLWSLFARFRAVPTQMGLRATIVATLASGATSAAASTSATTTAAAERPLLLGFGTVAAQMSLRATVIAFT